MVKRIEYDKECGDYAGLINGDIACFGKTYQDVENKLNELIYQRLTRQHGKLK